MIGIIAALDSELAMLLDNLNGIREENKGGIHFFVNEKAVIALSGMGKVNAALSAQAMILSYPVTAVLNIGCAGGLLPEMRPGDLVIADRVAQHDLRVFEDMPYVSECDQEIANALRKEAAGRVFGGCVASGEFFVEKAADKQRIVDKLSAVACDMEGGAIGRACAINRIPFAVVRGISDGAEEGALTSFEENLRLASDAAASIVISWLGKNR